MEEFEYSNFKEDFIEIQDDEPEEESFSRKRYKKKEKAYSHRKNTRCDSCFVFSRIFFNAYLYVQLYNDRNGTGRLV